MSTLSGASRIARVLIGLLTLAIVMSPIAFLRTSAQDFGPASHQDDAQVNYLFGSGSTHGGRQITLRVRLAEPAPAGGQVVTLRSERPDIIPLPNSVTVPAGETEHTFQNGTNPVISDIHVRVSASSGGVTKGREITIREPRLRTLSIQTVTRADAQGRLTVCLSGAAPTEGIPVQLTSSNPAVFMTPPIATVEAGESCERITVPTGPVTEDTIVQVTAYYQGITLMEDTSVRNLSSSPPPTATATSTADPLATATNTAEATATNTAVATATSTPDPAAPTFSFEESTTMVESGGSATVTVCLTTNPSGVFPVAVTFDSSANTKATEDPSAGSFDAVNDCEVVTLTDVVGGTGATSGNAQLIVRQGPTELGRSDPINFAGDPAPTATETATAVT